MSSDPLSVPYVVTKQVVDVPLKLWIATKEGVAWYDPLKFRGTVRLELDEIAAYHDLGFLPRGGVVFDVGANNGVMSLYFATKVGREGHVYAFEPISQNVRIIQENARLNELENITAIHAAVGDRERDVEIDLDTSSVSSHALGLQTRRIQHAAEIVLGRFDGPPPTFLKIDVEGYEAAVLRGAQALLSYTPNLGIEVHPKFGMERYHAQIEDLVTLVDWHCYECWAVRRETNFTPEPWSPETPLAHQDQLESGWIIARKRQAASNE